jgi:dihydrofolate synthase/folylpolyglutamate synthase
MLRALSTVGDMLVATRSSNPRALPADDLAARAGVCFARVESVAEPAAALERARRIAGTDGAILVTGSLYLLAELTEQA